MTNSSDWKDGFDAPTDGRWIKIRGTAYGHPLKHIEKIVRWDVTNQPASKVCPYLASFVMKDGSYAHYCHQWRELEQGEQP